MVNRGKSFGCFTCRQRKIKCDEKRPSCTQCARSKRSCAGYPPKEPSTSNSGTTARGASVANEPAPSSGPSTIPPVSSPSTSPKDEQSLATAFEEFEALEALEPWPSSNVVVAGPPKIYPSMYPDIDGLVFSYFKANFFTPDPKGSPIALPGTQDCTETLNQAILSLGTLTIANNHGTHKDVVLARQQYGVALRSANLCLQNPTEALHDDTLAAILILGIFECLDCSSEASIDQWSNHIRGAFQLVRIRDRKSHGDQRPRSLFFYRIRALFTVICLFRDIPVPSEAAAWSHEYDRYNVKGLPALHVNQPYGRIIMRIADDLCIIQNSIKQGKLTDPYAILNLFRGVNESLSGWANPAADPEYSYTSVVDTVADAQTVWKGVLHAYKSQFIYMTYFHFRNIRLFAGLMLHKYITQLGTPICDAEQLQLLKLRFQLIDEIMHGIPWRIGYRIADASLEPEPPGSLDPRNPPVLWGYTAMWGLVFVCEAICHESTLQFIRIDNAFYRALKNRAYEQLQWCRGQLENVNVTLGIRQSAVFARHFNEKWLAEFPH